jgi:hypothetical protein
MLLTFSAITSWNFKIDFAANAVVMTLHDIALYGYKYKGRNTNVGLTMVTNNLHQKSWSSSPKENNRHSARKK